MMYEQLDMFDITLPKFKIDKPIRLIELFAGIGSQAMALRDLGVDFESYRISEWEVNANRSYKAIHMSDDNTDYSKKFEKFKWAAKVLYEYGISIDGKTRLTLKEIKRRGEKWVRQTYNEFRATHNVGSIINAHILDLRITDTDKYCYVITYSFPCQDLSVAGRQKGMTKGSGTRSGLLWEVERLLNEIENLPQVLIMENVPQIHSKANMPDFQKWIDFLKSKGYTNYWQDLCASDYGVAQHRVRTFMVSILGEYNYKFPQPIPLEKNIKEYLEDEVDEKYYINTENAKKLIMRIIENGTLNSSLDFEMDGNFNQRGKVHGENSICRTLLGCGHAGNEPKVCVDLSVNEPGKKEVANCITAHISKNGNTISNRKKEGNAVIVAMRGRNPSDRTAGSPTEQRLEMDSQGICNTLTSVQKDNLVMDPSILQLPRGYNNGGQHEICPPITSNSFQENNFLNYLCRIRKLTPLECWRLMGFSDKDFRKAEEVNSDSQLYKQAGNSIVKNVLMAIFGQMIPEKEE